MIQKNPIKKIIEFYIKIILYKIKNEKSIILLSILVFALSNTDLLVELEAYKTTVVKCLISSYKIRKDVVIIVEAVK